MVLTILLLIAKKTKDEKLEKIAYIQYFVTFKD